MTASPRLAAIALLLTLVISSCAGSSPANLYTLSPAGTTGTDSRSAPPVIIAIGPVRLPDYLDRPQIVTRQSAYQLKLAPDDRWAAPLYDMVPRVLVEDLALRLPSDRIVSFPEIDGASFDYRIAVDVDRFEIDANGEAVLVARWQVYSRSAAKALLIADDALRRPAESSKYDAYAAALSIALADLSDRIVQAVASVRSSARPLAAEQSGASGD